MTLDSTPGDMSGWKEVDFALNCTYIVPDQVADPSFNLPKAMTSIPRNLTFEYITDNEVRLNPLWGFYPLDYRVANYETSFKMQYNATRTPCIYKQTSPLMQCMKKHVIKI